MEVSACQKNGAISANWPRSTSKTAVPAARPEFVINGNFFVPVGRPVIVVSSKLFRYGSNAVWIHQSNQTSCGWY